MPCPNAWQHLSGSYSRFGGREVHLRNRLVICSNCICQAHGASHA